MLAGLLVGFAGIATIAQALDLPVVVIKRPSAERPLEIV
jgi:hypothetical protein